MTRILLLLLSLFPGSVLAFSLDELQAQMARTEGLQGRFKQHRHFADLDTQLTSRGHFSYQRDQRIVWILEEPVKDRLEFTPESAQDVSNATGGKRGRDQVAALLLSLLEGDWQTLEQRFAIDLNGHADAWEATLVPHSDALRERIERIRLEGGRYLDALSLHAGNQDVLNVRFFDQQPLSDTTAEHGPEHGTP